MGLFGGKKEPKKPEVEYLEGYPEVPECITQYESGLISALGKTTGELTKTSEAVLQALQQSSRSPYGVGEDRKEDAPVSSSDPSSFIIRSCHAEKQLVKDCLSRITADAKAVRFNVATSSDAASSSSSLSSPAVKCGHLPTTATPPPSFLFANFPSCDEALKKFTVCSERVAGEFSQFYGKRVDAMLEQRQALQRRQQEQQIQAAGAPQ